MRNWFYKQAGRQQVGPVTGEQIRQILEAGALRDDDLVRLESDRQWSAVSEVRAGLMATEVSSDERRASSRGRIMSGRRSVAIAAGIVTLIVAAAAVLIFVERGSDEQQTEASNAGASGRSEANAPVPSRLPKHPAAATNSASVEPGEINRKPARRRIRSVQPAVRQSPSAVPDRDQADAEALAKLRGEFLRLAGEIQSGSEVTIDPFRLLESTTKLSKDLMAIRSTLTNPDLRKAAEIAANVWGAMPTELPMVPGDGFAGLLLEFGQHLAWDHLLHLLSTGLDDVAAKCWARMLPVAERCWAGVEPVPGMVRADVRAMSSSVRGSPRVAVWLRNVSGRTLHNTTIRVRFECLGAKDFAMFFFDKVLPAEHVIDLSRMPRITYRGHAIVASAVSVWSDEGRQPVDRRVYPERRQRIEAALEKARRQREERIRKQREMTRLRGMFANAGRLEGRWRFSRFEAPIGIEAAGTQGDTLEMRLYDTENPAVLKLFRGRARIGADGRPVLVLTSARGGVDDGDNRRPNLANLLSRRDRRTITLRIDGAYFRGECDRGSEFVLAKGGLPKSEDVPWLGLALSRLRLDPLPGHVLEHVTVNSSPATEGSPGEIRRWDCLRRKRGSRQSIEKLEVMRDGRIVYLHDRSLFRFSPKSRKGDIYVKRTRAFYLAPDRRSLVLSPRGDDFIIVSTSTGRRTGASGRNVRVSAMAPLRNGQLATGERDGTLRIWTRIGRPKASWKQSGSVSGLRATDDGRWLFSEAAGRNVNLWRVQDRKFTGQLRGIHGLRDARVSPDGRMALTVAIARGGASIAVWDLGRFASRTSIEPTHTCRLPPDTRTVAVSEDWRRALVAEDSGRIGVWDLGTGRQIAILAGHSSRALSIRFEDAGRTALSGGSDGWIIRWRLP